MQSQYAETSTALLNSNMWLRVIQTNWHFREIQVHFLHWRWGWCWNKFRRFRKISRKVRRVRLVRNLGLHIERWSGERIVSHCISNCNWRYSQILWFVLVSELTNGTSTCRLWVTCTNYIFVTRTLIGSGFLTRCRQIATLICWNFYCQKLA